MARIKNQNLVFGINIMLHQRILHRQMRQLFEVIFLTPVTQKNPLRLLADDRNRRARPIFI